ncbi:MAG: hypothetical protein VX868_02175 [Chloroflexota bacterium]|jgi:hypothetical protein|nr:hypothetical protein [Chloroflexota bacterium]|tara:strand:- start:3436 stop:3849 length:414 start_codon:yes stop_codon:yes gene_type:complete
MKSKRYLVLLNHEINELLMDLLCSFIKQSKSIIYFVYVIEIPPKYPIDHEEQNLILIGQSALKKVHEKLLDLKIDYDINGENFILIQSRSIGVGIVKEAKRLDIDIIAYSKKVNLELNEHNYIKKYANTTILELNNL